MTVLFLIAAGSFAGLTGALLGIGGGVVLVPLLVFGFHLPLEEAVPASLMCVVASSCASAASYVDNKLTDVEGRMENRRRFEQQGHAVESRINTLQATISNASFDVAGGKG